MGDVSTATATEPRHRADRPLRVLVVGLEGFVGVGAFYGGVALLADSWQLPAEWLEALPFEGWSVPGVLLLGLIGAPGLVGASVEALGRRWVIPWSLAYGVGLAAWIGVQVLLVPPFFLQPVIAVAGTAIATASWARLRLAQR
jgi:hypothetical protein